MNRIMKSVIVPMLGLFLTIFAFSPATAADAPKGGEAPQHGASHQMMPGKTGMPSEGAGMMAHMEEIRKTVAKLREHEKKMEGITDPAAFRAATLEHLKMIDDLQASHLKHMESMMGRMTKGMGGMEHGKGRGHGGCDGCSMGGGRHGGGCGCACGGGGKHRGGCGPRGGGGCGHDADDDDCGCGE